MSSLLGGGKNRTRFNVMTVGQRCMGKTTFLDSLLRDYVADDIDAFKTSRSDDSEAPNSGSQKNESDTLSISEIGRVQLNSVDLVMYDSCGYGDFINNQDAVDVIRSHLIRAHADWRSLDVQCMSPEDINRCDERIHCVFYFFSAHSMKEIDIKFLAKVSGIVPIIPVVAKADTMNLLERNSYLNQMNQAIRRLSNAAGSSVIYDFESRNKIEAIDLSPQPFKNLSICDTRTQLEASQSRTSSIYGAGSMETMGESIINGSEIESNDNTTSAFPLSLSLSAKADRGIALVASGFMTHSPQCRPSPEFVALFPNVDDFDNSTTTTLFDENNLPIRRDSICSLDSNEGLGDSNQSNRDRSNTFSAAISSDNDHEQGSYCAGTSEDVHLSKSHSSETSDKDRGDSDQDNFFDQETFVNIGKALSNNAHEHFDFGPISGDSDYEEPHRDNMMESAVFVIVRTESGSYDYLESEKSLSPEGDVTVVDNNNNDALTSTANSITLKPSAALICKLVSHEVCDLIANPGEKAVCRIVSKIVCEHLPPENSEIDAKRREGGETQSTESLGHYRGGSGRTSTDTDCIDSAADIAEDDVSIHTQRNRLSRIGSYFQGRKEEPEEVSGSEEEMAVGDQKVGVLANFTIGADDEAGLRMKRNYKSHVDGNLGSSIPDLDAMEIDVNGVHRFPNIFSIICKENQSNNGMSDWGVNRMSHSSRNLAVAVGLSDVSKLQYLLFEGPHIEFLINETREKSIKLFPTKMSAILWNFTRGRTISLKGILDSIHYLFSGSFTTISSRKDFSNLSSSLDPVPLSIFCVTFCRLLTSIWRSFWLTGCAILSPLGDRLSEESRSMKVTSTGLYLMVLRSILEKFCGMILVVFYLLRIICETSCTILGQFIEKTKIYNNPLVLACSTYISNSYAKFVIPNGVEVKGDNIDVKNEVVYNNSVNLSLSDVNMIRTYVRVNTSKIASRESYLLHSIYSVLTVMIAIWVLCAFRCMTFSREVQRFTPLSTTTSNSLRSSSIATSTYTGSDHLKDKHLEQAWIYTSQKLDLSSSCSSSCSKCGLPKATLPTEIGGIEEFGTKMLNKELLASSENTATHFKPHYQAPYPAPTEERYFSSPIQHTDSIDASSGILSYCLQHDQNGVFECLSTPHSFLALLSFQLTNTGVTSTNISGYTDTQSHITVDSDTGAVSTGYLNTGIKSAGSKGPEGLGLENDDIGDADTLTGLGDVALLTPPAVTEAEYDAYNNGQCIVDAASTAFEEKHRTRDFSDFLKRPVKLPISEDHGNVLLLTGSPSSSSFQHYFSYLASEMVNHETERYRTLKNGMSNPEIFSVIKKTIQFIMNAIKKDLDELKDFLESFATTVIDGYLSVMKYFDMEFHRW